MMKRRGISAGPIQVAIASAVMAAITARTAGWPLYLCVGAVVGAVVTALVALNIDRIARAIVGPLRRIGRKLRGRAGRLARITAIRIEAFLARDHNARVQSICFGALTTVIGASIISIILGAGQWGLAGVAIGLGGLACYWGGKVCVRKNSKRAMAGFAVGSFLISLSANFVAGALAGSTSLDRSVAEVSSNLKVVLTDLGVVKSVVVRTEEKVDLANTKLDSQSAELKKVLGYMEEMKRPGVDPAKEVVPPDILAAARVLINSKDAQERAIGYSAAKQWTDWQREIDALNSSPAIAQVHQIKTIEGDGYYAQGRFDDAIPACEAAFALKPNDFTTRNNLAIALYSARIGDLTLKRRRAIEVYTGTLALPGLSRHHWAGTQNNLGIAWQSMPTNDLAPNLTKAIECYNEALKVYTQAAAPMEWAMTQNNLGIAWQQIPTDDPAANPIKAIECYTEALKEYTRAAAPMQWATTQNNLGTAWAEMPSRDPAANLTEAIECFTESLKERTRAAAPKDWAMTQNNLGIALANLSKFDAPRRCTLLRRSIVCIKAALQVWTPEAFPREHADTTENLAICRKRYEALGYHAGKDSVPFDDIPPTE